MSRFWEQQAAGYVVFPLVLHHITSVPEPRRWNRVNRPIIGLPQFVVPELLLPAMTHVLLRGTADGANVRAPAQS